MSGPAWPGQEVSKQAPASPAPVFIPNPGAALDTEAKTVGIESSRTGMADTAHDNAMAESNQRFNQVTTYRQEFYGRPEVKQFADVRSATQQIVGLASGEPSAMGDLGLIFSYMKALDPGSTVREGEQASAQNAAGVPDQIRNMYNRVASGERLNGTQRRDMAHTALEIYRTRAVRYNEIADDYRGLLTDLGADPDKQGVRHAPELKLLEPAEGQQDDKPGLAAAGEGRARPSSDVWDRAEYLQSTYGLDPGKEQRLIGAFNARRGDASFSEDDARKIYGEFGITPSDEDISRSVEGVRSGLGVGPADTSAAEKEYVGQLDAAIKARGGEPESGVNAAGLNLAQGATLNSIDEVSGVGGFLNALLHGDNPAAGYETERDLIRREQERGQEAHPVVSDLSNIAGALATGGIGFRGVTTIPQAIRVGAETGALAGFNSGEGATESLLDAGVGAALGAAGGYGGQRLSEYLAARAAARPAGTITTPADRYAAGQKFGLDLSLGDAGGRSAKMFERSLDAQPASAEIMNAPRQQLSQQLDTAVGSVADSFGPETSFRAMGEAAQAGTKGWRTRFDAAAKKAYEAIPIKPETSAALTNTIGALEDLTSKITSNPQLAGMLQDKRLVGYLDALRGRVRQVDTGVVDAAGNPVTREVTEGGQLSWNDLKQLRTRIGEEIGEQILGVGTLRSDLRRVYGALSQDMEATAEAQGPAALRAFKRANTLFKDGQDRLERVWTSLLGKDGERSPEAAAGFIQRIAKEGKGSADLARLSELRKTLKPGEWAQISNGLVRLLGQPANSAGREFNPAVFVRSVNDMAPEAKNMLFGGENKPLRQNLEEFTEVLRDIAANDSTRNTSGSAFGMGNMLTTGAGAVVGQSIPIPVVGPLLGILIGHGTVAGAAKLWTRPTFVRWATGYTKMLRGAAKAGGQVNQTAFENQMKALGRAAAADSVIATEALGLQRQLIEVFDGPARLAASDAGEPKAKTATTAAETR